MERDVRAGSNFFQMSSPMLHSESTNLKSVLRTRQQARNRKSCLPCRERKVRCNRSHPCLTCCKRGHPDLCQYQEPNQHPSTRAELLVQDTALPLADKDQSSTRFDLGDALRGSGNQDDRITGVDSAPSPGETRTSPSLLGGRSILAMNRHSSLQAQENPDRQEAFETGIFPLLGIDGKQSQATADTVEDDPCNSLPSDEELIKLFEFYRDRVHPFHFILFDLQRIEKAICAIVITRTTSKPNNPPVLPGGSHFLGLLHAILACGAQFSDLPADSRLSLSQKHAKHAFDLLRVTEYLSKPRKEALQTLLLLGNVLQNDMNPQAAWILGGTTIRLALSLGVQNPQNSHPRHPTSISIEEARILRQAIVWQDALLSLAFDRPPASQEMDQEADLPLLSPSSDANNLGYRQAMNWLCHFILRHSSLRKNAPTIAQFTRLFEDMDLLHLCEAPHLRSPLECSSIQQIEECYSFELHKNFSLSTLCRRIVSSEVRSTMSETDIQRVMVVFQTSLKRSARAFIQLHSTTSYARRSWAFVHNGLVSALLLSFMADTRNTIETREIQAQLIGCLGDGEVNLIGNSESGGSTRLSNPHKNCLQALQKLSTLSDNESGRMQDEDRSNTMESSGANPEPCDDPNEPQIQGFDMGGWLHTFDFDSYSPLGAFDFIMSDRNPDAVDLSNIGIS